MERREGDYHLPELEFGEASDEGAELVGAVGGEGGSVNEVLDLGVDLRGEEGDEEVEDVDAESVRDQIESLYQVDAESVHEG